VRTLPREARGPARVHWVDLTALLLLARQS
jgi:hypothetical protein